MSENQQHPSNDPELLRVLIGTDLPIEFTSVMSRIADGSLVPGWQQCRDLVEVLEKRDENDLIGGIPILKNTQWALALEQPIARPPMRHDVDAHL